MDSSNGQRRRQWHLEKTVSIGHILTTFVIAGSMFSYTSSMDKRIEVNTNNILNLKSYNSKSLSDFKDFKVDVKDMISGINNKLDRIIDKIMTIHSTEGKNNARL